MVAVAPVHVRPGIEAPARPNGAAAAALLAAGVGCLVLGLATVGASASPWIKDALDWWSPVGPLGGKTGLATAAWAVAWGGLHAVWRKREVPFARVWGATLALIFLGWVLTFPPVFEAVAAH